MANGGWAAPSKKSKGPSEALYALGAARGMSREEVEAYHASVSADWEVADSRAYQGTQQTFLDAVHAEGGEHGFGQVGGLNHNLSHYVLGHVYARLLRGVGEEQRDYVLRSQSSENSEILQEPYEVAFDAEFSSQENWVEDYVVTRVGRWGDGGTYSARRNQQNQQSFMLLMRDDVWQKMEAWLVAAEPLVSRVSAETPSVEYTWGEICKRYPGFHEQRQLHPQRMTLRAEIPVSLDDMNYDAFDQRFGEAVGDAGWRRRLTLQHQNVVQNRQYAKAAELCRGIESLSEVLGIESPFAGLMQEFATPPMPDEHVMRFHGHCARFVVEQLRQRLDADPELLARLGVSCAEEMFGSRRRESVATISEAKYLQRFAAIPWAIMEGILDDLERQPFFQAFQQTFVGGVERGARERYTQMEATAAAEMRDGTGAWAERMREDEARGKGGVPEV